MTYSDAHAKDRSYSAERRLPAGSLASFVDDIRRNLPGRDAVTGEINFDLPWTPHVIPAGDTVEIVSYSNAGFRGIEVSVRHNGKFLHGISAGYLSF